MRHSRLDWLIVVVLVVLAAVVLIPCLWAPVFYDEGINLQIVGNLLHGHGYATNGDVFASGRPVQFDYRVTTGPTVMLPVAGAAWLLGQQIWVFRLVPLGYFLVLMAAWWLLGKRELGTGPAAAATVGVLMINGVSHLGTAGIQPGSVLGESASTAYLVLAVLCLRWPRSCGLLVGLAVMTKVVMLLAIPGVAVALLQKARQDQRPAWSALAMWCAAGVLPAVAWQGYRIGAVGWTQAMTTNRQFLAFLSHEGGGVNIGLGDHALAQVHTIEAAGSAAILLALIGVGAIWLPRHRLKAVLSLHPSLMAVGLCGLTLELWWLFIEGQGWARHSIQASELLVPLLFALGAQALDTVRRVRVRRLMALSWSLVLLTQVAATAYAIRVPLVQQTLGEQRQVAHLVADHGRVYHFEGGIDLPELTLLDPRLVARRLDDKGGLLVVNTNWGSTAPCGRILETYARYVICRVPASG